MTTTGLERIVADLAQRVERRFFGKYRGFVVDNADPEQLGRLKLRVPSVLGTAVVTGWAWPCAPYGGMANQGFLCIPERKAGVWVEFEEGDLEFPIWVGTFWSKPGGESELPRPVGTDGADSGAPQDPPTRKILATAKGHTLQFEDRDGEELVTLTEATHGHVITLDKEGIAITDGANGHTVLLAADGITITDGANPGNAITLASGGVTVKTSGTQIELGASGVRVGAGATEPFVLGNKFLAQMTTFLIQLATHTHIGNLGAPTSPPVAPIQFQTAQTLSTKHTIDG